MAKRLRFKKNRRVIPLLFALAVVAAALVFKAATPMSYTALIQQQAARQGLEPALVAAVIRVESRYQPTVVSARGAVGLMQIMPETARWIRAEGGGDPGIRLNLTDPEQNIALGTWYLHYLLGRYAGNLILALSAYNSGPGATDGWIRQGILSPHAKTGQPIPYPETRNFVARVLRYREIYRLMYGIGRSSHTDRGG